MDKSAMFDAALDSLMGEMDEMEGSAATAHSADECPDPLGCGQHDAEFGKGLAPEGAGPAVKIEISKSAGPSLQGLKESDAEGSESAEGLSPEESEMLKKLLR
jgi:hypothetical protein